MPSQQQDRQRPVVRNVMAFRTGASSAAAILLLRTALFCKAAVLTESTVNLDELIDPPGTVPASVA